MLRQQLINTLQEAAERKGYNLMCGFKYQIAQEATIYPLAWLYPIKLNNIEGRLEGIITYNVEMILIKLNHRYQQNEKENIWSEMEKDIIDICCNILSKPNVYNVEKLKTEPAEYTLTNQGELSLNCEFNVKMNFLCK